MSRSVPSAMFAPISVDVGPSGSCPSAMDSKTDLDATYEVINYDEIQFPDFRHTKRLGRGSYGTVMPCYFRGKPAAAKLVESNAGTDFKAIRTEAELLHGFRHKNIIELYALFHGEMCGLVLELMEGGSLSELLHQHKHIAYQTCHALNWAIQVANALSYLHAHSFIHRDIKPSNMLLTRDYIGLKLCDFGTVVELQTSMTNNRGTAAWMAPEVFRGRKYDQQCDIFSLGISLWEIIARRQPFIELAENPMAVLWRVAENGLRPPRIEDLPEPLMELIERCWANDPNDRPYLEEVQQTLDAFLEIFPNANLLPLVDRTTGQSAIAPPVLFWDPALPPPPTLSLHVPSISLPFPPPAHLEHRRTGSHDISAFANHRHHLPVPQTFPQPIFRSSSHSLNYNSHQPGGSSTSPSASYHYSPNTVPIGFIPPLGRQASYSPCLSQPRHPQIHPNSDGCLIDPPLDLGNKKRKKSNSIKKFLSGLKKELIQ